MFDTDFGIKVQPRAVLAMLQDFHPDFLPYKNGKYLYADGLHSAAWYNGREDGIVIWFQPSSAGPAIVLVVVRHRNSDPI